MCDIIGHVWSTEMLLQTFDICIFITLSGKWLPRWPASLQEATKTVDTQKSDGLLNPTCTCAQGGDYVLCLQHVDISEALQ